MMMGLGKRSHLPTILTYGGKRGKKKYQTSNTTTSEVHWILLSNHITLDFINKNFLDADLFIK